MKHVTSLIAVERATCSASVVDKETVDCDLECQTTGQFGQKITNPVLEWTSQQPVRGYLSVDFGGGQIATDFC